jgi:phosphoribosylglycinamide formyltransferase 2
MQVAHGFEVINMLDGETLTESKPKHQPDLLFLRWSHSTERFTITKTRNHCSSLCESGKFHDEQESIRDLASKELGLKLPLSLRHYCHRITKGVEAVPCVVKPLMSSSEKDNQP